MTYRNINDPRKNTEGISDLHNSYHIVNELKMIKKKQALKYVYFACYCRISRASPYIVACCCQFPKSFSCSKHGSVNEVIFDHLIYQT